MEAGRMTHQESVAEWASITGCTAEISEVTLGFLMISGRRDAGEANVFK